MAQLDVSFDDDDDVNDVDDDDCDAKEHLCLHLLRVHSNDRGGFYCQHP